MSGVRAGVSLSQLLAEVDRLESELKKLGREAQRGGDFVHQLQEIVEKDTKRVEDMEDNTSKITQEMLEWEAREKFLTDAVSRGTQSSQLLVQMETQARSKLELEMKITNQFKEELVVKVRTFAKKVEDEEDKYQKIPQYVRCPGKRASLQSQSRSLNPWLSQQVFQVFLS
jgi:chromosome segregation ATPase